MIDIEKILNKIRFLKGITKKKDIAELLGVSPQDFSARVKRETILPLIVNWAINENVNLDWLIKGVVNNNDNNFDEDPEISELMEMAQRILKSETNYAGSLKSTIRSFNTAIEHEIRISELEERMSGMEKAINRKGHKRQVPSYKMPQAPIDDQEKQSGVERQVKKRKKKPGLGK